MNVSKAQNIVMIELGSSAGGGADAFSVQVAEADKRLDFARAKVRNFSSDIAAELKKAVADADHAKATLLNPLTQAGVDGYEAKVKVARETLIKAVRASLEKAEKAYDSLPESEKNSSLTNFEKIPVGAVAAIPTEDAADFELKLDAALVALINFKVSAQPVVRRHIVTPLQQRYSAAQSVFNNLTEAQQTKPLSDAVFMKRTPQEIAVAADRDFEAVKKMVEPSSNASDDDFTVALDKALKSLILFESGNLAARRP